MPSSRPLHILERTALALQFDFWKHPQRSFRQIADTPGVGAPRAYNNPALVGLRMMPVPGFPQYGIYSLTTPETVEILRIVHRSRDFDTLFAPREQVTL